MMRASLCVLIVAAGCGKVKDSSTTDAGVTDAATDAAADAPIDALVGPPVSCKAAKAAMPAASSGPFTIDPDGLGANAPFTVYCDMAMDGGGWTLAMAQTINGGFTWPTKTPSYAPPTMPTTSTANVLHHEAIGPMGVTQMMLMGGDRILKLYYPRTGVPFVSNYRDLTERSAFRAESVPNDAPHTGYDRDPGGGCGHQQDACTTTDFAAFKAADATCPRDATNSHSSAGAAGNCGSWGNCPGNGQTPPTPTPNCWFYGGQTAADVPMISTCPAGSQAPWANYTPGVLTGLYTLWVR